MGYVTLEYDSAIPRTPYTVRFNPDSHMSITEAATRKESFDDCLQFILEQYQEQVASHINPAVQPLSLEVKGDLPSIQREILENIVKIHNQIPEIYTALRARHQREQIHA